MRTVRRSGRISGGGWVGTWSGGGLVLGGCLPLGGLLLGGVPGEVLPPVDRGWSGGCTWSRGGSAAGGGVCCSGVYLVRYSPCGQTHACKNITFATLLRTVTRMHSSRMRTARSLTAVCGVCVGGGSVCGIHTPLPPWTEFLTHACENITFPQLLLQSVTKQVSLVTMLHLHKMTSQLI